MACLDGVWTVERLELEYHDLLSLFEFMDNGDGQITLTEFIEGSTRLRGSAKALDVWRLETKAGFASNPIAVHLSPHKILAAEGVCDMKLCLHIETADVGHSFVQQSKLV